MQNMHTTDEFIRPRKNKLVLIQKTPTHPLANIVPIRSIPSQMELMVGNKNWQRLLKKHLQRLFALISPSPGHLHEGSLTEVVNVAIVGLDRPFFPLVVAQKVELLGEVLVNHNRL